MRDPLHLIDVKRIGRDNQTAARLLAQGVDSRFYFLRRADGHGDEFDTRRLTCGFDLAEKIVEEWSGLWIEYQGRPRHVRCHILEKTAPFSDKFRVDEGEAGDVAAWMRQTFYQAEPYRILDQRADDRNRTGDFLQCHDSWRAVGEKHVGCESCQFPSILLNEFAFAG